MPDSTGLSLLRAALDGLKTDIREDITRITVSEEANGRAIAVLQEKVRSLAWLLGSLVAGIFGTFFFVIRELLKAKMQG